MGASATGRLRRSIGCARPPERGPRRADRARRRASCAGCSPRPGAGRRSVLGADELDEARALSAGRRALAELRELARRRPELAPGTRPSWRELLERVEFVSGERPGPGAVAVLDPLALRARRVRALFLCGLQEGVFPAPRAGAAAAVRGGARAAGGGARPAARPSTSDRAGRRALPVLRRRLAPGGAAGPELARGRRRRRADARGRCSWTTSATCSTRSLIERRAARAARRRRGGAAAGAAAAGARARGPERAARRAAARARLRERLVVGLLARSLDRLPGALVRRAHARARRSRSRSPSRSPAAGSPTQALQTPSRSARRDGLGAPEPRAWRSRASCSRARSSAMSRPAPLGRSRAHVPAGAGACAPTSSAISSTPPRPGARSSPPTWSSASASTAEDERGEGRRSAGVRARRGREAARPDRPRRRERARRGGRSTTTRAARARRRPAGSATATSRWRCTCAPSSSCSGCERRGRLLPAAARRRPARARRARRGQRRWSSTACSGDSREHGEVRELLDEALAHGARGRGRRPAAASSSPGRRRAAFGKGGCSTLRSAAASGERAPPTGPTAELALTEEQEQRGRARPSRCSLSAARRQRQDLGARRALRQGGPRGRDRAGEDPRDHVHRARRRRAARARPGDGCSRSASREAARDTEAAFVGTFHGFCARLLRAHPLPAGLDPDFAILDEGSPGRLRERAFRSALAGFLHGGARRGRGSRRRLRSRPRRQR